MSYVRYNNYAPMYSCDGACTYDDMLHIQPNFSIYTVSHVSLPMFGLVRVERKEHYRHESNSNFSAGLKDHLSPRSYDLIRQAKVERSKKHEKELGAYIDKILEGRGERGINAKV